MKTTNHNHAQRLSDEALIRLVKSGQEHVYGVLIKRHEKLVRYVLQRYFSDPEAVREVMQDTFLRAYRSLDSFRGESKFGTWLGRIAVSLAINRLRTRRYEAWAPIESATAFYTSGVAEDGGRALEEAERRELLSQALHRLRPGDATALDLFYFREQSIEEIGRITGWSSSNIKSRLSRARQRLHTLLVDEGLYAEYYS
jgi:RNA polymerase sigma-70 factor (ECF subfamily)